MNKKMIQVKLPGTLMFKNGIYLDIDTVSVSKDSLVIQVDKSVLDELAKQVFTKNVGIGLQLTGTGQSVSLRGRIQSQDAPGCLKIKIWTHPMGIFSKYVDELPELLKARAVV